MHMDLVFLLALALLAFFGLSMIVEAVQTRKFPAASGKLFLGWLGVIVVALLLSVTI